MFNPIPKDAPEFISDKAHFITTVNKGEWQQNGTFISRSRFYHFSIGRSEKVYQMQDKFIDDKAHDLLEEARTRNERLVIKGYLAPTKNGSAMFVVLTHFGIYHKLKRGRYAVFNPETGEEGFYQLRVDLCLELQTVN